MSGANEGAGSAVSHRVKRLLLLVVIAVLLTGSREAAAGVQITQRPRQIVRDTLVVPVLSSPDVVRTELFINGIHAAEHGGGNAIFRVPVGRYIRRLRVRVVGYDASGAVAGEDEIPVNDPQPPFRARLYIPPSLPQSGFVELTASVSAPQNVRVAAVDFYIGEQLIGTDVNPPYAVSFDAARFPDPLYARIVARAAGGIEVNDVAFWGDAPRESVEVVLKQVPLSVSGKLTRPLAPSDLELNDDGKTKPIEALVRAVDQPLNVILLIDSSESMVEELPIVKRAAREFVRSTVRPNDRVAVVGFHQRTFWLTGFTSDIAAVDAALENLAPLGRTHLYDAVIETLFELQKLPGRHALLVFSDGVNSGGEFKLDHLVHYARYSGVPIYPIIRNAWLSRFLKLGLGTFEAKRFANIAEDTGATYFIVESAAQLPGVYRTIARELAEQYLVQFRAESRMRDEWHTLGVRSRRKELKLRIPRGYFP